MIKNGLTQNSKDNFNFIQALGFTGTYQDSITACYPLGNGYRWYLPGLMRFNAPDDISPFGAGGLNPYAYCADDPINHSDPSGHMTTDEPLALKTAPTNPRIDAANRAWRDLDSTIRETAIYFPINVGGEPKKKPESRSIEISPNVEPLNTKASIDKVFGETQYHLDKAAEFIQMWKIRESQLMAGGLPYHPLPEVDRDEMMIPGESNVIPGANRINANLYVPVSMSDNQVFITDKMIQNRLSENFKLYGTANNHSLEAWKGINEFHRALKVLRRHNVFPELVELMQQGYDELDEQYKEIRRDFDGKMMNFPPPSL